MPVPSTVDEFLQVGAKSGVLDKRSFDTYVQQLRSTASLPESPSRLAKLMVRDGVLTNFQAGQFLQGKWRRFVISGKYVLLERLGAGGMGSVFLCEHRVMRRRVALKVLPDSQAQDPRCLERFHREARAVATLDHPNIVRAYDIDNEGPLHFLVMEYVDGNSLHQIVKQHGQMDILRACHYIYQAALGLQHAHEVGLVHRDIKPGNLLLDRTGTVKVLDMGLALFFHDEQDELTKQHDSRSVLGTADYLAPEQALDSHGVDIRADIYSLGVTFYFLLTGQSPFEGGSVAQKLIWHQVREPLPIDELRPDVPAELVEIISVMMAKNPDERFQDPSELVDALGPWTDTPIAPPPEEEMPRLSPAVYRNDSGEGSSFQPPSACTPAPRSVMTLPRSGSRSSTIRLTSPSLQLPRTPIPGKASKSGIRTRSPSSKAIPVAARRRATEDDEPRPAASSHQRKLFLWIAAGAAAFLLATVFACWSIGWALNATANKPTEGVKPPTIFQQPPGSNGSNSGPRPATPNGPPGGQQP